MQLLHSMKKRYPSLARFCETILGIKQPKRQVSCFVLGMTTPFESKDWVWCHAFF